MARHEREEFVRYLVTDYFLGFDGIIAPSARWSCEAIVLFLDILSLDDIERVSQAPIEWTAWREQHRR